MKKVFLILGFALMAGFAWAGEPVKGEPGNTEPETLCLVCGYCAVMQMDICFAASTCGEAFDKMIREMNYFSCSPND